MNQVRCQNRVMPASMAKRIGNQSKRNAKLQGRQKLVTKFIQMSGDHHPFVRWVVENTTLRLPAIILVIHNSTFNVSRVRLLIPTNDSKLSCYIKRAFISRNCILIVEANI